jgi:glycerol-3-phosphate acyltransferase PlsY
VAFALVWAAVAAITRYSSLAGLSASAVAPVFLLWWTADAAVALLFFALTALLWMMHRANIARLLQGAEAKIGASRNDGGTQPR